MKFKVWDSHNKKWADESDYVIGSDGTLHFLCFNELDTPEFVCIPVFSTGQTDKNGVEIYEGDITDKGVVKYGTIDIQESDGKVTMKEKYHGFYIGKYRPFPLQTIYGEWPTVIGNKYENPELLEKI